MSVVETGAVAVEAAAAADSQPDFKPEAASTDPRLGSDGSVAPGARQPGDDAAAAAPEAAAAAAAPAPMSKNALKRLRRQQEWEEGKEDRRKRRKEKRQDRRERRREERKAAAKSGDAGAAVEPGKRPGPPATLVPVALILDCDFEAYMTDKEHVSLASQVTRCYADNRAARFRAHLWVAGWRGRLRDRFRAVLADQQRHWRGVGFVEGDFLECARAAREPMRGEAGGQMIAPLQRSGGGGDGGSREPFDAQFGDVVYLTSDAPHTLERLEPHTCYVVGGLVDRNREKGLCYRRARERNIRTARLPIGQFMQMQSRQVLATNHVVEIMLRWLECDNWGEAFMAVIPKHKGGRLIGGGEEAVDAEAAEGAAVGDESLGDESLAAAAAAAAEEEEAAAATTAHVDKVQADEVEAEEDGEPHIQSR